MASKTSHGCSGRHHGQQREDHRKRVVGVVIQRRFFYGQESQKLQFSVGCGVEFVGYSIGDAAFFAGGWDFGRSGYGNLARDGSAQFGGDYAFGGGACGGFCIVAGEGKKQGFVGRWRGCGGLPF